MTRKLEEQFAVHDRAATAAREAGATPRQATIKGLAAELAYLQERDR